MCACWCDPDHLPGWLAAVTHGARHSLCTPNWFYSILSAVNAMVPFVAFLIYLLIGACSAVFPSVITRPSRWILSSRSATALIVLLLVALLLALPQSPVVHLVCFTILWALGLLIGQILPARVAPLAITLLAVSGIDSWLYLISAPFHRDSLPSLATLPGWFLQLPGSTYRFDVNGLLALALISSWWHKRRGSWQPGLGTGLVGLTLGFAFAALLRTPVTYLAPPLALAWTVSLLSLRRPERPRSLSRRQAR